MLAPLGQHRRDHVEASRGKRRRRRRHGAPPPAQAARDGGTRPATPAVPPPPALARFVDVGLVSITRALATHAVPAPASSMSPRPSSPSPAAAPYAAVFVVRSGHPSALYAHLPQMVAVASQQAAAAPPIRLVGFSRAVEDRLRASLGVPRVSGLALRAGAPQAQGLLALLAEKVPPVDVRWLAEAQAGTYRATQIHMADVRVGPRRKKKTGAARPARAVTASTAPGGGRCAR